jgi:predicted HicB family RNase H-like nuclease
MGATAHITVRVSPELREKIVARAKADRRTLSQWVAIRLEELIEELERSENHLHKNG